MFTQSGSSWTQRAELTASDGAAGDNFGYSVAISGNTVVVGAGWAKVGGNTYQGAVYVFTGSGSSWAQTAELNASDGVAYGVFGVSVAISGATIVVGVRATVGGIKQGAAYVFTGSGSAWPQTAELTASDGTANAGFGTVAISSNTLVVGACARSAASSRRRLRVHGVRLGLAPDCRTDGLRRCGERQFR